MSIEKIKQIACEKYGKTLTDEQAAKYVEKYGKLCDDELDSASGGYGLCDEEYHYGKYCEPCGVWCDRNGLLGDRDVLGSSWKCPICGTIYK